MNYLTGIILVFSAIGALDKIFGNRFGLGKEFEKAFMLLGTMALSMVGMIVISPFIAQVARPVSQIFTNVFHIDASIVPASLFANDMGGAPLAVEMASNENIGLFNGLVVSSMMGCTISFTIPFAFGVVNKDQHKELLLGLLSGIVTIPVGCFVSGLICRIEFLLLLKILLPLIIFSAVISFGLIYFPEFCIKAFKIFGVIITALIITGLVLGIMKFLAGVEIIKGLTPLEDAALICVNTSIVLSGSFPFMYVVAKVLSKPFGFISDKIGVNRHSVVGVISCLASSATTFGMMDKMDKKGVVLNSAFAVSGAFILGSHFAFTMSYDSRYVLPVILGKVVSGVLSLFVANIVYKNNKQDG